MICPSCLRDNLDSATFCQNCGTRLPEGETPSTPGQPEAQSADISGPGHADDVAILRSKGLGDLIGESVRIYRARIWTFILLGLLPQLVILAIFGIIGVAAIPAVAPAGFTPFDFGNGQTGLPEIGSNVILPIIMIAVAIIVGIIVAVIAYIVSSAGIITSVGHHYLEMPINFWVAARAGMRSVWRFILIGLLLFLIFIVPFLLMFILVGIPVLIYIFVRLLFAFHASVLEDLGPVDALSRSWNLVRGHWWRTFGIGTVFVLLVIAANIGMLVLNFILGAAGIPILGELLSIALGVVITPFLTIGATVVYLDLRVRQEGELVKLST